ncbi:hypothetical protein [Pontibacter populi]|uniref:Uncharacterized protein n=1 Tax=Pontibacter populi TaxID=890055 RepID=A0ABV1RXR5_9BACT
MKTVELTKSNATLRLEGSESTRSMDIKQVNVKKWPASGESLKLIVLDEKDIPIYSQLLEPPQALEDNIITIDKRFVFYDHLSVQLEASTSPFSVIIHFE